MKRLVLFSIAIVGMLAFGQSATSQVDDTDASIYLEKSQYERICDAEEPIAVTKTDMQAVETRYELEMNHLGYVGIVPIMSIKYLKMPDAGGGDYGDNEFAETMDYAINGDRQSSLNKWSKISLTHSEPDVEYTKSDHYADYSGLLTMNSASNSLESLKSPPCEYC